MISSTKGIVLHRFKYSDTKLIAKIYTENFGLKSYLIYVSKSKKSVPSFVMLQPFFILDMQVYNNERVELQKIKEISNAYPLLTIPFDITKNSISLFLSEFLMKTLKEDEPEPALFDFIVNSIICLDKLQNNYQNFHLLFLFNFCKIMGIMPENNYSEIKQTFDIKNGKFISGIPNHNLFVNSELSFSVSQMFDLTIQESHLLKINNSVRKQLLKCIIEYFNYHLGKPGQLKTLNVLTQLF